MSKEISRRAFLKTGTAAAVGLAMAPNIIIAGEKTPKKDKKKKLAPSDKLNILGVGIGGRGAADLAEIILLCVGRDTKLLPCLHAKNLAEVIGILADHSYSIVYDIFLTDEDLLHTKPSFDLLCIYEAYPVPVLAYASGRRTVRFAQSPR